MIVRIKDTDITPRLTIGALSLFNEITKIDLLFGNGKGGTLNLNITNMRALVYSVLKFGDNGDVIKKIEDIDVLGINETLEIGALVISEISGEAKQGDTKKKAKK